MVSKCCNTCNEEKTLDQFPKNSKGMFKVANKCKSCSAKFMSEYRKQNPITMLAKKYKIETLEKANELYYADECEICHRTSKDTKLVVDHCHTSDKVRGKLCDTCNKGLGQFYDKDDLLLEAVLYLRKYRNV